MIRLANKFDQPFFFKVLEQYKEQMDLPSTTLNDNINLDYEYLSKMFQHIILGGGLMLIHERDGKPAGLMLALINSNLWDRNLKIMNHVLLWVEPELRKSTIALTLLRAYKTHATEMVASGKIKQYTLSKAYKLAKLDLEKMGYTKAEEMWIGA